jgi:hypothetical protein
MHRNKISLLLILISALWSINSTCRNTQNGETPGEITWEVLDQGAYGGVERSENKLITDEAAWAGLWEEVGKNRFPAPERPSVDFAQKYVVACFMGMRTSGGHGIEIQSMSLEGSSLQVKVMQESPGRNCMVTDAITHPYIIVTVNKENISEASFEVENRTRNCDQ